MFENMVLPPILGAPADSKDLHLEEVSTLSANVINLKSGYAMMLDNQGLAVTSDGTSFYGVRSESNRNFAIGTTSLSVNIGVRRKGIVFVAFSGNVTSVVKGTKLKIATDGTFTTAESNDTVVGIAEGKVKNNIVALSFNADFYSYVASPSSEPKED